MSRETVTLVFCQVAGQVATVVTDGQTVRSYTAQACRSHSTLHKAIAYLECKGYRISMEGEI